mmetsp:Transcript_24469/g.50004  ORF Transcript_24469/g.50004 Transcript_24469/m.50004 type:complete len:225 (+) Transcript_24469:412-1086(+)
MCGGATALSGSVSSGGIGIAGISSPSSKSSANIFCISGLLWWRGFCHTGIVSSVSASSSSVGFAAAASLWTRLKREGEVWKDLLVLLLGAGAPRQAGSIRSCCPRCRRWLRRPIPPPHIVVVFVDKAALLEPETMVVLFAHRAINREDFDMVLRLFLILLVLSLLLSLLLLCLLVTNDTVYESGSLQSRRNLCCCPRGWCSSCLMCFLFGKQGVTKPQPLRAVC